MQKRGGRSMSVVSKITLENSELPSRFEINSYKTFSAYDQAENLSGWDQGYCQLSVGKFEGNIVDVHLGPIQIFRERINQAVDQDCVAAKNSYVLGGALKVNGDSYFCGDQLHKNSIYVLQPNEQLNFRTSVDADYIGVVFNENLLNFISKYNGHDLSRYVGFSGTFLPASGSNAFFVEQIARTINELRRNPKILSCPNSQEAMIDDLCELLFQCFYSNGNDSKKHMRKQNVHRYMVEKSKDYVLSEKGSKVSVLDLCAELRVSRRTLHNAFVNVLGINPVTYIRYLKLNEVRKKLINSNPEVASVADVATEFGFWHLGIFSTYYRQLFNEMPSVTLKTMPKFYCSRVQHASAPFLEGFK